MTATREPLERWEPVLRVRVAHENHGEGPVPIPVDAVRRLRPRETEPAAVAEQSILIIPGGGQ